jgi:RNA methyltransferase, TrmH family
MPTEPLSPNNPRIRDAAKLAQKKHRRETGLILIEGARLVADALASGAQVREVFCTEEFGESTHDNIFASPTVAGRPGSRTPATASRAGAFNRARAVAITEEAAGKLSDTRTPQGVFAVVEFVPLEVGALDLPSDALVLVADGVGDPGNLGTMVRSAAALGASALIASGESCDITNPKAARSTMGAIFRLPVAEAGELGGVIDALKARGMQTVAAVPRDGAAPWDLDLAGPIALLIGSEADGLPSECIAAADQSVTISMPGGTESLNAAASATALLYEAARQRA